jgi:molybdopterin molybdotransferase
MITLDEAQKKIDSEIAALAAIETPLLDAVGCALAHEIAASIDVPGFRSSVMDGIALRKCDLSGVGPWKLPLQETIAAGDRPSHLSPEHVSKIMTGAPLPDEADLVIPVEDISFESGNAIIRIRPEGQDFIRPVGDDIKKGCKLFNSGYVLRPVDIGVLASVGLSKIEIIPKPRIALFSTGSEIVEPGEMLRPGQIYDSNNIVMRALLSRDGHNLTMGKRVIQDDLDAISEALIECAKTNDLVITMGAVSMGDFDFIPQAVNRLGGEIIFHKVAVKPGKPILLVRFENSYLVGVPGNPVSVMAGYHLFVRRVIARLMGKDYAPRNARAVLGCDLEIEGDRLCLVGARFEEKDGRIVAQVSTRQRSNRLSAVIGLDGFVFVDGGTGVISKGTEVYCEWL